VKTSIALALLGLMLPSMGWAENPFLHAKSDAPVSAKFKGAEWNDEYEKDEYAWSTQVTTQRVATAKWGSFFKITFDQITTKAPKPRDMQPLYFLATDNEIFLVNEEKPDEAITRFASQDAPPKFEPDYLYGLAKGSRTVALSKVSNAKLVVKGDRSTYEFSHNSGHFTHVVWQRGVGLVEYGQGYGARKEGFSLKR
jgi:hypothetical protein